MKNQFKNKDFRAIIVFVVCCLVLIALWGDNIKYQKKMARETALADHIDDFGDTTGAVTIEGDEVPLAKPKIKTKTSTKTKTKKYKLKKLLKNRQSLPQQRQRPIPRQKSLTVKKL